MAHSPRATNYKLPVENPSLALSLVREVGVSPLVARMLVARGFESASEVLSFIGANLDSDWSDPFHIHDMKRAAETVLAAVRGQQRICVFGDYDLDGISATAVVVRGLAALGNQPVPVLPSREEDGYGLTPSAAERIRATDPSLVITVDCGVSAGTEIAKLVASGIDVVVTDHHTPGEDQPVAVPVVNPKLNGESSPSYQLAGAGVALKLIHAVGVLAGNPTLYRRFIELATLGTVADVMPLRGENRALVAEGVRRMAEDPDCNIGIRALAAQAGVAPSGISAERISFSLAPRLNAAGRVSIPDDALDLLLTDDPEDAKRLAELLEGHNRARQRMELELTDAVIEMVVASYRGERGIVLAGEGWSDGVKGIVASRVAQRYGVPTILATIGADGVAVGSGRSVGKVNLYRAIESASVHLERFGGHTGAAGLAVRTENLDAFRIKFIEHLDQLPDGEFLAEVVIDALVRIPEMTVEAARELKQLEPFGAANPHPLFMARGVTLSGGRLVGKGEKPQTHLQIQVGQNGVRMPAIMFRCPPDIASALGGDQTVVADIVFQFELDTYRGVERPRMIVREIRLLPEPHPDDAFISELFEQAEDQFLRRDYAGILDAPSFNTKLVGVTFEGRQEVIAGLDNGEPLELTREPLNPADHNAIAVNAPRLGEKVGHLNRDLAAVLAPALDDGVEYEIECTEVTGGDAGQSRGVNVRLTRVDAHLVAEERSLYRASRRSELASLPIQQLEERLISIFIGDGQLHEAQRRSLDLLEDGLNTLTVMATGRGKSLIFHLHAAKVALRSGRPSIFVYPLRALVSDQVFHLEPAFAEIGLSVAVVNGETSESMRAERFEALANRELDVVLTTPEFLQVHWRRFAQAGGAGFVVVDEAHHIGQAKAGNRPAYAQLGEAIRRMADESGVAPVTLAVTATAPSEVAARIGEVLGITEHVLDPSVRDNLRVSDERNTSDKESRVIAIAETGEKAVVYVNSRGKSVKLAQLLRRSVPELAPRIAYYNADLTRDTRREIERRFRTGEIKVIVATSAFGEGVNVPDIRHVVLYHLPYSDVEFNQMAGRGGRDGAPATIYLLYGEDDASINEYILGGLAPTREAMVALYRALMAAWQAGDGEPLQLTNNTIADRANRILASERPKGSAAGRKQAPVQGASTLDEKSVSNAIGVFRELGLLSTEGHSSARRILMHPNPGSGALDLKQSVRYAEGLDEIEDFGVYRDDALQTGAADLLARVNRPILPA